MRRWLCLALLMLIPLSAMAETETVYQLLDEEGTLITSLGHEPSVGDEYISGDDRLYRVERVDEAAQKAYMKQMGRQSMPDVSWLEEKDAIAASGMGKERRIAMYCTHSDESYVKGDGKQSDEKRGGIYDVAGSLAEALSDKRVTVELDETTHNPHDAGAYRRSRQTAVQLLKTTPDAIFDIHRDGIPDPDEYALTLGGQAASKVRLLVGRGNPNASANKAFALQLKAVADKVYPGLIKDIYMGKGVYNQDLYPRSVLLEMGTHTLPKERVVRSTTALADVIYRTLYGGITGAAGGSDVRSGDAVQPEKASDNGSGKGILWILVAAGVGIGAFALVSTGSAGGAVEKIKRSASEMTGGLIGKKPKK